MREPFSIGMIGWGDWIERRIMRVAGRHHDRRGFGQARQPQPQQHIVRQMIYSEGRFESVFSALSDTLADKPTRIGSFRLEWVCSTRRLSRARRTIKCWQAPPSEVHACPAHRIGTSGRGVTLEALRLLMTAFVNIISVRLVRAFLFLVLLHSSLLNAQTSATVLGSVLDPQGAAVPGATVRLRKAGSSASRTTITDQAGQFLFAAIELGAYTLHVEATGFSAVERNISVRPGEQTADIKLLVLSTHQQVTVTASVPGAMTPDPSERILIHDQLLDANPGRPGAPISIPGLPIETASGGIKAPQYFAPGVAGDHGEPIAQYLQIGDFLFANNLPANAHGNGYADPNILIANAIGYVESDGGAFNVREGNNAVNLAVDYGLRDHLPGLIQLTSDYRDVDFVAGWGPKNPETHGWLALEASYGNGFLQRLEHRQQYKLNGYRTFRAHQHEITLFGSGYYGFSFVPGLIPIKTQVPDDTIDSRQLDRTHNSLVVASDRWRVDANQQFQFSGFFRTYSLTLRSNFGDGLIQQSEFRTVSGGEVSYLLNANKAFSLLAGLDARRDAPRGLDLKHADQNGIFQPVTSNDLTLGFAAPFLSFDGGLGRFVHYDIGARREEISFDNVDKINATNSFNRVLGITLPKSTLTLLPLNSHLPTVAFSIGEAFHTNDPRIGNGMGAPTLIAPSHAAQLVISKTVWRTDFRATLARITNSLELAKIDPDTGLQEVIGPSLVRYVTLSARHTFSFGFLQGSWSRANAIDRITGEDIPEAPRFIWDVLGDVNRLPFGIRARTEYEAVGRKPLGDGFTSVPVREFRFALVRSFAGERIDLGLNALIASGYTGQTLETVQLAGEPSPFERIVGVPLRSYAGISMVYRLRH